MKHSVKPLASGTTMFLLQFDKQGNNCFVVYDSEGAVRYIIESSSPYSKLWNMYSWPQNTKVAVLSLGFFHQRVAMLGTRTIHLKHNNGGLLSMLHRHFYDTKGNVYSWNRRSHYLERICNPNSSHEERRERVAYTHQLRNGENDWELLVDIKEINEAEAIATAFVTLKTQWHLAKRGIVPGAKISASMQGGKNIAARSKFSSVIPLGTFTRNDPGKLRIYQRPETLAKAREFFNPPSFLKLQ